ncbi:MAG TPA: DUF3224 domain-containing protein [Gemmatales bacterium]|nr:DUF3224 domain-containing protein [Gemmatales bacterium]
MSHHAKGTFEVKLVPQSVTHTELAESIGRMSIDKKFVGDLTGSSLGEMLSAMGTVKGSAGYVAIEKVTGSLQGKTGTFCLQHTGVMNRGAPSLVVTVIPDSGTGELAGLSGTLTIKIENKQHYYEFEYMLPAS